MFGIRGGRGGKNNVLGRSNRKQYGGQITPCQQLPPTSLASPSNVYSNASCDSNISKIVNINSDSIITLGNKLVRVVECLGDQAGILEELKKQTNLIVSNLSNFKILVDGIVDRVDALETNSLSSDSDINLDEYLINKIKPLEDKMIRTDNKTKEIESTVKKLSNIKFDVLDIVKRRNNLVFEKVPEGLEPTNLIKELAKELDIEGLNDFTVSYAHKWKFRPFSGEPKNMMCIKFRYETDKFKFLGKTIRDKLKSLDKQHKFYGIKIFPDRSPAERKKFKELLKVAVVKNSELAAVNDHEHIWIVKFGRVFKVKRTPGVGV